MMPVQEEQKSWPALTALNKSKIFCSFEAFFCLWLLIMSSDSVENVPLNINIPWSCSVGKEEMPLCTARIRKASVYPTALPWQAVYPLSSAEWDSPSGFGDSCHCWGEFMESLAFRVSAAGKS